MNIADTIIDGFRVNDKSQNEDSSIAGKTRSAVKRSDSAKWDHTSSNHDDLRAGDRMRGHERASTPPVFSKGLGIT